MALVVLDPKMENRLVAEREATGLDRYDERWDGVYMMAPIADTEHLDLQGMLVWAIRTAFGPGTPVRVAPGGNVSDREEDWTHNYRIPDVVVVVPGSAARDCSTHWCGGPDFCAEITSLGDRSRDKLEFYSRIGVRELLLVDRNPWKLELYRLAHGSFELIGRSELAAPKELRSMVVPVSFKLVAGTPRPQIELTQHDGLQRWIV